MSKIGRLLLIALLAGCASSNHHNEIARSKSSAVVVVHAPSNDVAVLRPLMPAVLAAISEAKPGIVTHIHG